MRPVSEQADGLLRRYSKHEEMGVVLHPRKSSVKEKHKIPGRAPEGAQFV